MITPIIVWTAVSLIVLLLSLNDIIRFIYNHLKEKQRQPFGLIKKEEKVLNAEGTKGKSPFIKLNYNSDGAVGE